MENEKTILHLGCGPFIFEGFGYVNIDSKEELRESGVFIMDVTKPLPYSDNSVDGIVSMHMVVELPWRQMIEHFKDCYRVLKPGGVLRIGVPHIDNGYPLGHLLGYGNINLFNEALLIKVLEQCRFTAYRVNFKETRSSHPEITVPDNRPEESMFIESVK